MRLFLTLFVLTLVILMLAACDGTREVLTTQTKHRVVMPPETMWDCPAPELPPDGDYTQRDVSVYILEQHRSHQRCKNSQQSVREFLEQSKDIIEGQEQ